MSIAILHEIHDPAKLQQCAEEVVPLPSGLHVHQFFPSTDMAQAVCLCVAPSIGELRDYIDGTLKEASTQSYFPVAQLRVLRWFARRDLLDPSTGLQVGTGRAGTAPRPSASLRAATV